MKKVSYTKRSIDIIFVMVVFLIFTFSVISALFLAINFYRSTVDAGDRNADARVAVAYIRETVRQNDASGAVSIDKFDGNDCIKIDKGRDYILYIYYKDNELRELYTRRDAKVSSEDGNCIVQLAYMSFSELDNGCILVRCKDMSGDTRDIMISERSQEGVEDE